MSSAAQIVQPKVETIAPAPESGDRDQLDSMPWLPCTLSLQLQVTRFTIANLLALKEGSIVETACSYTSDVPLRANGVLVGWCEFEVVGDRLAARVTEQA